MGVIKDGDVISLVSGLLNINALESAKDISNTFNLGLDVNKKASRKEVNTYKENKKLVEDFNNWENKSFQILCDYLHLLWQWKAIKDIDNELLILALKEEKYVEYVIDNIFLNGTIEDKIIFWKNDRGVVNRYEQRIKFYRQSRIA